jgi:hypothetical protein
VTLAPCPNKNTTRCCRLVKFNTFQFAGAGCGEGGPKEAHMKDRVNIDTAGNEVLHQVLVKLSRGCNES